MPRGPGDGARADLGELAAHRRLDVVTQQGGVAVRLQRHDRSALGEAGRSTGPFAGDAIAVRRVDVAQRDLAREARVHRPDPGADLGGEAAVFGTLAFLAEI